MPNLILFCWIFPFILLPVNYQNIVNLTPRFPSPLTVDYPENVLLHDPKSLAISLDLEEPNELISIETLLKSPELFHKRTVTVRGRVTQPELHLDSTGLFFDFVFVLKEGIKSLVVFGRHDRTLGSSPIAMDNIVEVTGIFWKDRIANDYHFENNLEAITVQPYPSLIPDRT